MMDYGKVFLQTKNLSLLLVEDYKPLRDDMVEVLEDFFATVEFASNGSEALKMYEEYYSTYENRFDIVISDIQMPVMNGVELSEALRKIHKNQQIIILSAHADSDYLIQLINLNVAQFLSKPVQHEKLLDTLYHVSKTISAKETKSSDRTMILLNENYIWDQEKLLLSKDGTDVELTRHELILLQLFMRKDEKICTNTDIMEDFYANHIDISEKNIRNLVFKLRKKLPEKCISSVYGLGYKFISLV